MATKTMIIYIDKTATDHQWNSELSAKLSVAPLNQRKIIRIERHENKDQTYWEISYEEND